MAYPNDTRNMIISRLLSDELTAAEASKVYDISERTIYDWLKNVRDRTGTKTAPKAVRTNNQVPLPRGMTLNEAIAAVGFCGTTGFDTPESGSYCRSKGITLEELK